MKISGNVYEFPSYIVQISDNGDRTVISKDATFHLRMLYKTGVTLKWGKTFEEDPTHCPFGPEIADIEEDITGIADISMENYTPYHLGTRSPDAITGEEVS